MRSMSADRILLYCNFVERWKRFYSIDRYCETPATSKSS